MILQYMLKNKNNYNNFIPVITIDGTSGSGKGTLCLALAKTLCWHILNSGAIYRVLALLVLRHNININHESFLVTLAMNLNISFSIKCDQLLIMHFGVDISKDINNETIGNLASKIATLPKVRKELLSRQRSFLTQPGLVADGRDMGTVIFPNALMKIFLNASSEERALRRMKQLQKSGFNVNFKRILDKIKERDNRDSTRLIAPLLPAKDALILNSTYLSINEILTMILKRIKHVY